MLRAISLLVLVGCQSAVSPADGASTQGVFGDIEDTVAPKLAVDPSMHAEWLAAGPVTFAGTVSDDRSGVSVTVDGQAVTVSDSGVFTVERVLRPGAHTFAVVAEDAAGNTTTETLTVFAGEAAPLRRLLPDAARAEIGEDALTAAVAPLAAEVASAGLISSGEDFSPFGSCVAVESIIDDVAFGDVWATVEADADEDALYLDLSFEHLSLDISGVADVCGIPEPFSSGYASADGVTVRLSLTPGLIDGELVTGLDAVSVSIDDVTVELPELADGLSDHGLTVDDIGFEDAFARTFEQPFTDRKWVGDVVAELIYGGMPVVGLDGQQLVSGGLALGRVSVSEQGLSARYVAHHVARGSAIASSSAAAWLPISGAAPQEVGGDASVAVSLDAINHALATAWQGGAFTESLELDGGSFATTARLLPALPPMVQQSSRGISATFGEIYVELSGAGVLTRSTARLSAELRVSNTLERGAFSFTVDTVSGGAPSAAIEAALREAVYDALDAALPAPQEPGWLNNGDQLDGAEPVLAGRQRGWLLSELDVTP